MIATLMDAAERDHSNLLADRPGRMFFVQTPWSMLVPSYGAFTGELVRRFCAEDALGMGDVAARDLLPANR